MHELSIVMSILEIADAEAHKANATHIEEIELEIGQLNTIEIDAFNFAWEQAVKDTILSKAIKIIHHTAGKGKCMECGHLFTMEKLYDTCENCNSYFVEITEGKELKVKSITI
ncbi:MAG: hydrogenase maturation nickel metallochaperone HypA [Saprospiraceae bacterium]|jgi:hydrogenase nickel incorporation protein HypA/HybF|nr:hydrogenase maturation nickel metallochaperone HypA [Saprospiraceae bacterium]MBK9566290.1 hydrogenase maturation nickel metallochaperone HypA [Saprospiraceae bacterium]MBP6446529.1 hydrogenase maturation nickel metallochaperone HypA [Saprospiraceae bacterium]